MKSDFVIYTGSDPDACWLRDYLSDRGFITIHGDMGEAAMVFVVDTDKKKLVRVLKGTGAETVESRKYWRVAKVGIPTVRGYLV